MVADGAGTPSLKDPKAWLFKIGAYGRATVGDAGSVGLQAIWRSRTRGQFESKHRDHSEFERSVSAAMETAEAGGRPVMVWLGSSAASTQRSNTPLWVTAGQAGRAPDGYPHGHCGKTTRRGMAPPRRAAPDKGRSAMRRGGKGGAGGRPSSKQPREVSDQYRAWPL